MKKTTAFLIIAVLSVALIITGLFAWKESTNGMGHLRAGEAYGGAAMGELASSLGSMDEALLASRYATNAPLFSQLCAKAAANASGAVSALSSMPYSTQELEKLSGYLNSAGDWALYLSREGAEGRLPDEETRQQLEEISDAVSGIAQSVMELGTQYSDGALLLDSYAACADDGEENTVGCELRRIDSELEEFPELEYDGKYSASALTVAAKSLEGAENVTESEAKAIAADFLGVAQSELESVGRAACDLPCWSFSLEGETGDFRMISVSEQGGQVLSLTGSRRVRATELDMDEARKIAQDFLAQAGVEVTEPVSESEDGGLAAFTFAGSADGVMYPADAVSISIALDSGEVCAYDATKYILNHTERDLGEPEITAEQAAEALPESLTALSSQLTAALTEGGSERLCYVFACEAEDGTPVSVYIDAKTGVQTKIEIGRT